MNFGQHFGGASGGGRGGIVYVKNDNWDPLSNGIGDFLSACPRDQISGFKVASGGIATSAVDIELQDGGAYELEVPRASKGKAEKLKRELGF